MINPKQLTALGALWLTAASAGCSLDKLSLGKWPEPEIADVHPIRMARSDEAVAAFDAKRNDAEFEAAQASWQQGDYPRCRESIEKILSRDPNHRASLLLLADVALETDQPVEAVATLRRLASIDPNDIETAYRLGLALEAAGDVAAALPYLRQAVNADPTNPKYADALPDAERQLAEQKKHDDKTNDAEFVAALADWEAGRDAQAAERAARFLADEPDHIEANILQAEIDLDAGRRADALQRMDRLAVRYPQSVQVCQATGLLLQSMGNAAAAEHCFAEAQRLSQSGPIVTASYEAPADETATPNDGAVQVPAAAQSPTPVALDDATRRRLRAAVEQGVDDPQTALAASIEALKLEQPELAYELASVGAKRFPESAGLQRARGMAAYRLGRYSDAESALRQSLSLDNTQALSYFLLGSVLDRLNQPEAAERYRSEAARLDSRYASRK